MILRVGSAVLQVRDLSMIELAKSVNQSKQGSDSVVLFCTMRFGGVQLSAESFDERLVDRTHNLQLSSHNCTNGTATHPRANSEMAYCRFAAITIQVFSKTCFWSRWSFFDLLHAQLNTESPTICKEKDGNCSYTRIYLRIAKLYPYSSL